MTCSNMLPNIFNMLMTFEWYKYMRLLFIIACALAFGLWVFSFSVNISFPGAFLFLKHPSGLKWQKKSDRNKIILFKITQVCIGMSVLTNV